MTWNFKDYSDEELLKDIDSCRKHIISLEKSVDDCMERKMRIVCLEDEAEEAEAEFVSRHHIGC